MRVRIGVLRLADSAPVAVAERDRLFAAVGLDAVVQVEPSWANIADKLAYGLLDAAVMLPPLALAGALGLRQPATPLVIPMGLSLGGNTIVLADAAASAAGSGGASKTGAGLVAWLRAQDRPPRLAVVHTLSTHNLLLRHWIAASGGDPDRDLETVVVPPDRVVSALAEGRIAGFCAGAPWGDVAQNEGVGRVVLGTSAILPQHPEKCLAVRSAWARAHPAALTALLRAMLRACAICDDPAQAARIAAVLACAPYSLPQPATLAALPGGGGQEQIDFGSSAWLAEPGHGRWFAAELARWGWLEDGIDTEAAIAETYRPDLLKAALLEEVEDEPSPTP